MKRLRCPLRQFALPVFIALTIAARAAVPCGWICARGGFKSPAWIPSARSRRKLLLTDAQASVDETDIDPAVWLPSGQSTLGIYPVEYSHSNHHAAASRVRAPAGSQKSARADTLARNSLIAAPVQATRTDSTRTAAAGADTAAAIDSAASDSLTISDWLQDMQQGHVQAPVFEAYHYPLFLYSSVVRHSAVLDSTGKYMEVRETVFGHDVRIPVQIPLGQYIRLERRHFVQETWEHLAHAYTLRMVGGLQSLMAGVTNISIPIPSNPVLSIFGPPQINLNVSGAVDITGGFSSQKENAATLSQYASVANTPAFSQNLNINVSGTVGNKLNIDANWDTQNQFDYQNQLKVKYTGYKDEIIQSVEAGNVSMSTPSTFVGSSQALFGIKAKLQFGPLTLTALASQQKGQSKTLSVSGGSSSQSFSLHAYQFATNYFFIDTMYIGEYERFLQSNGTVIDPQKEVTYYHVYESEPNTASNPNIRKGYAVIDLPSIQSDPSLYDSLIAGEKPTAQASWGIESGEFQQLTSSQYSIDEQTGVITLNSQPQQGQIVAIVFDAGGQTYGSDTSTAANSRLVLNMIVPQNLIPTETDAWRLQLRNIYPIGGEDLTQTSLQDVQITYTAPGQAAVNTINNINLLQVFGLDNHGPNGTGPPDGVMDWNPGIDIDPTAGMIILPYLEPFVEAFNNYAGPQGQKISNPSSYEYAAIYDTTESVAETDFSSQDRFLITGSYTSSVSSHYNLGFNLVQGSVKVLLNGAPLNSGTDYTVDYVTGEVDILDQAALQPGANVQVQYQTNDLFQLAAKSLSGLRANYKVNKNTSIGFTLMNYTQQSPTNMIQLGQEPISNTMLESDFGTSFSLPFLTKALNALPILATAAPSRFTVHAEAAYMLPNPNTSQSIIPSDDHQGMAYIDNFEGAKLSIPLPITFSNWTMASPPEESVLNTVYPVIADSVQNYFRAWTYWYNRSPGLTTVQDIWPQKQLQSNQQAQPTLSIGMLVTKRGQFNRAKDVDTTLFVDTRDNWGGMMTLLPSNASDLVSQNITGIEIWMKVDSNATAPGVMHIDIGQISEDVVGDGVLHTEDPNGYNALISDTLDYGIDGLHDSQERADFPWIMNDPDRPWAPNGLDSLDPDGDDYWAPPNFPNNAPDSDFYRINGTEGNAGTSWGKFPDTEDLNHNGVLDQVNSYYEYAVKLDTVDNPYITGGGHDGWYEYIIPLQDYSRAVGNPTLSDVQYFRMWFNGLAHNMHIQIAELELIGNQWKTRTPNDSTMQVSVVSVEDNPDYTPPAQGLRPATAGLNGETVLGNEQSLALILNGLPDDSSQYVYKVTQAMNVFNYRTMKMYVHGDPSFNYVDSTDYDAAVYLRFGSDSSDFYEYRQPIKPEWQDFVIDLAALTSLKEKRDSVNQVIPRVAAGNGVPGATYWVKGNPSLQSITYFQIGVENPPNTGTSLPLTGEIWIDVLRLTNVNNNPGLAYQVSSSLQLADLGSISFNFTNVDPYFHSLTAQFGSLTAQRNWGIGGSFDLARFLPRSWIGTSIPFYYNHTESLSNPLYLPNSDVLVSEAVIRRQNYLIKEGVSPDSAAAMADSLLASSQTLTVNNQWSISNMRIDIPSNLWLVNGIVDNITTGFNWNGSKFRNTQTKAGSQWSWQYHAAYSVQLDPDAFFTPFPASRSKQRGLPQTFGIRYLPNSINLSLSANRSLSINQLWGQPSPIITPDFTAQRSGGFTWQLTNNGILNPSINYTFNVSSSLLQIESDTTSNGALHLFPDSYVFKQIFLNGGLINFGQDYNFGEQFALNTSPNLPLGIQKYFTLQTSYTSSYNWTNNIQNGPLGKSAGFSSSLQLGTNLHLKSLTDPWFSGLNQSTPAPTFERGRGRRTPLHNAKKDTSSANAVTLGSLLDDIIKIPFLDFQDIGFTFSSTNTASDAGLPSLRPGMGNFFGIPLIQQSNSQLGPSQLYQLGLVSDPYSKLLMYPKSSFPFFRFALGPTRRIDSAGVSIPDNFSNSNNVSITTSRNLWPGAQIQLSWNVGWSYNRNTTFSVNSSGYVNPQTVSTQISGQVTKSFFSFPPVLIFKSGINQVAADYQELEAANPGASAQNMSKAFLNGFETFPIFERIFGSYAPDLNYSFSWSGLQSLPFFKYVASQVSLNDAYRSSYSETWQNSTGTGKVVDAQTVSYGFQPLIGLDINFKSFYNGSMSGSILYNTSTQYSLNPSAQSIAESYTGQLSVNAQYTKNGFSLPFLGLNLKNNVSISASYSVSASSNFAYQIEDLSGGSKPLDGTDQISINLQFQYDISERVKASIYYKNTRVVPTAPGSSIPGTTTNEAGVNVHVSIGG